MRRFLNFSIVRKFVSLALILVSVAPFVLSQTKPADTDTIMRAMSDELNRSVNSLQLKDLGKPYFVEFGVSDIESFSVSARFGALVGTGSDRSRTATTQLRLGNYESDNTNLFTTGTLANSVPLVLDDNYDAIRHDLWLATDASYKSAIEQISAKRTFLQSNPVDEKLPDLSKETPVVSVQPRQKLQVDAAKWQKIIRDLSAIFRKYPEITDSSVTMFARLENRYLLNNEGTQLREPNLLISINIYAETVTSDNLRLNPSRHIYAKAFDQLPSVAEITNTAEKLAQDITKVRNAPIFDETYIGPVLFTERASVQLFSQILAPNLADERPPLSSRSGDSGVLSERINRRILPPAISVIDDPKLNRLNNNPLIGGYQFDSQGVAAKPINVVENGVLKTLFSTRVPTKKYPQSNGRARSGFGRPFVSNLIFQVKDGKSVDQLKKDLIESCKAQSLPYGILIREIDSTFFLSGSSLSVPILAYKVYVNDGREELIRNLSIDDFPIRELRQILGVGNDSLTLNHLFGNGDRGQGVPYSVTAPSVLLDEIVLRKDTSSKTKPLIMTHPFFDKSKK